MKIDRTQAFQLGQWRVEPSRNRIIGASGTRRLEGKVMGLLLALADSQGAVVTKDVLMAQVWPDRVVVEGVLKRGISELRRELGDNAKAPTYIQTIAGQGYRLIQIVAPAEPQVAQSPSRHVPLMLGVACIGLLAAILWATNVRQQEPSINAEATSLYLRGRHLWSSRTGDSIRESLRFFDRALQLDPNFAEAEAAKGSAYIILSNYSSMDHEEAISLARRHTERALKMDPTLAEATAVLANITSDAGDPVAALELYQKAIALDPNSVPARQWYAGFLFMMGYLEEAHEGFRMAYQLDPLSGSVNTGLALSALTTGNLSDFEKYSDTALSVGASRAELFEGIHALRLGDLETALKHAQSSYQARGWSKDHLPAVFAAHLDPALEPAAREVLEQFADQELARHEHLYFEWALIKDADRALAAVLANRSPLLSAKLWLPENSVLRQHPSFYSAAGSHHQYLPIWRFKGLPDLCSKTRQGVSCR